MSRLVASSCCHGTIKWLAWNCTEPPSRQQLPANHQIPAGDLRLCLLVSILSVMFCVPPAFAQQQPSQKQPVPASEPDSDSFYDAGTVQVVHLLVHDSDLERMKSALPNRIYVPATFRWNNQTIPGVGIRFKGNSSSNPRQQHKRGFLIKFNEFEKGRRFLGMQRIALDNGVQFGSLFSEQIITEILRDLGIKASRCNFAKLYFNGSFHGVYVNVERVDSIFVKRNFADASGALYKVDEGGPGSNLAPFPDSGNDGNQRRGFEPKSKSAKPDAPDVRELISKINQTPAEDFARVMEATIEMDAFLQTMAVMLFSGAFDQYTGWQPHNYYLYHEPNRARWYYIPWDLDVGFADNAFRRIPVLAEWNAAWPVAGGPPRPLIERIVDDPKLLARYRQMADAILEKYFHPNVLLPKVDALYDRIKDDLINDPFPHRRATNPEDQDYDSIVASIREFIRRRYDTARAQLDNPGTRPKIVRNPAHNEKGPQPGTSKESAPSELRVVSQTASSVTLQWNDNATDEFAHIVQRADGTVGNDFRNYIGKPGANISTATDRHVTAGRTYRYRVYAVHPSVTGPAGTGVSKTITVRVRNK